MSTRTIKIILEYDGTDYAGFQRQAKGKTIQGTLEKVISQVCQEKTTVIAAGRTDAGVHALGQVCHFKTHGKLPAETLTKALNAELPRDIVIRETREMPDDFHARYSATARTYAYFVLNRPTPSALYHRFVHWVPFELDTAAMDKACRHLIGENDCSSFLKAGSSRKNLSVHVKEASCTRGIERLKVPFLIRNDELVTFRIKADSFLYTMVRTIMGTLLEIGRKKKPPEEMKAILEKRTRKAAGAAISPKGLFLVKVDYPRKYR